jgi:inosine triphosphate pyrophosphatase
MKSLLNLVFVTGNSYKLNEVRNILGDAAELESVDLDLPEIQGTIEEIAKDKCHRAAEVVRFPGNESALIPN